MGGIAIEVAVAADASALAALDRLVGTGDRAPSLAAAVAAGDALVARVAGEPVGFAVVTRAFFGRRFLDLVVVHPGWRRAGVGTALVRRALATAGAEDLFTSTNLSNRPMQGLLAALGFAPCGYIDQLDPGDPEIVFVWHPGS